MRNLLLYLYAWWHGVILSEKDIHDAAILLNIYRCGNEKQREAYFASMMSDKTGIRHARKIMRMWYDEKLKVPKS